MEGFACECAVGFVLGKDGRSCVTNGEGQPDPGGTKVPMKHPPATAASPVPKRTGSPRVHGKPGETPHVPGQGSSTTSIPEIPWGKAQSTVSSLQTSPQANSKASITSSGSAIPSLNSTSSSAIPHAFDSSTVVFILVSIAVVVLVILTMAVLGLFKLCFHKSPSSQSRKGSLAPPGNDAEAAALRSSSAHWTDNEVKVAVCGTEQRAPCWLTESSLGSGKTWENGEWDIERFLRAVFSLSAKRRKKRNFSQTPWSCYIWSGHSFPEMKGGSALGWYCGPGILLGRGSFLCFSWGIWRSGRTFEDVGSK